MSLTQYECRECGKQYLRPNSMTHCPFCGVWIL